MTWKIGEVDFGSSHDHGFRASLTATAAGAGGRAEVKTRCTGEKWGERDKL